MTVLCQGPRRQQNTWWWKTDRQRLYSICSCGGHVRVNLLIISVPKLPVGFLEINFVPPVFCPHGICYGFEVMQSCESPRHPFNIFRHRFQKAPQVIVYDNACKLHQFCLNREPYYFRNTLFVVDRFHWRGHVGCSAGYCLNSYTQMAIKEINSQVNEQANAGLQRIRGQLAYMTPENFMFTLTLFLTIKNKDVQRKLDVSVLHV